MLLVGAPECSPAPLYWLVQSAVVRSVDVVDLSLRVKYRAVSLGAATLTVLLLFLALQSRLGLTSALVAPAVLLAHPAFHHYAAQNRAYMTWVFATAILVVTMAEVATRPSPGRAGGLVAALASGLLVALAVLPGCFQALSAFAVCALVWRWLAPEGRPHRGLLVLALGGLAFVALDFQYWAGSPCRGYTGAPDLDISVAPDPAAMVRQVIDLVWSQDASVWAWSTNIALLLGAAAPVVLWRERVRLPPPQAYALTLGLLACGQLLVALPVAASLAAGHYLFLPRMFIFVLVPRAVLVALGLWVTLTIARRALPERLAALPSALSLVLSLAAAAYGLQAARAAARAWHAPLPTVGTVPCAGLEAPRLQVMHRPADHDWAFTPNFLARFGQAARTCHARALPSGPPRFLLALDAGAPADWFRVADTVPAGFQPIRLCDVPVTVDATGRLWP